MSSTSGPTPHGLHLKTSRSAAYLVYAGFVIIIVVPFGTCLITPPNAPSAYLGPLAITLFSGCALTFLGYRGEQALFRIIFWVFTYVFLGLAPLVQLRLGEDPDTTPNVYHNYDATTSLVVITGLTAFLLGQALEAFVDTPTRRRRQPARARFVLSPNRVTTLTLVALSISALYIVRIGPSTFVSSRDALAQGLSALGSDSSSAALGTAVFSMTLLVATVANIALLQQRSVTRLRIGLTVSVLAVLLFCINPISSPRFVVGSSYLALLATVGTFASPRKFRIALLSIIAALIFVFPVADLFRHSDSPKLTSTSPLDALTGGDFDSFAQINNAVWYVHIWGTTQFHQALGVLLFWVPRATWPTKPVDTGILLAQARGYGFDNLSAPLWGEFFINGGWPTLVAGMMLLGLALTRMDRRAARLTRTAPVLYYILPFYLLILLRGSLLQAMSYLSVIIFCGMIVYRRVKPQELKSGRTAEGMNLLNAK